MDEQWAKARRILAMRLDNIGDVVMTGPALRAIKENLPEARITLMASPAGSQAAPLLPWVDEAFSWRVLWQDLGKLEFDPQREWALVEELRLRRLDAAIIFTSFSQTPHPAGFVCSLAGIPLRLGASKERGAGELTTELESGPDALHQTERNLRLIEGMGFQVSDRNLTVEIPEAARANATDLLRKHGLAPGDPYLLLNPWTSTQARTYFPERFASAALGLAEQTGWPVVLTGVEKDLPRSRPLLDILDRHAINAIGRTSVPELAALVAETRLAMTNNTAVLHLADATGTPCVITYSGTDLESQWRPRRSRFRLLRKPTPCSPCYAFTCPYHRECMDIPPEEVVQAGLELLSNETG
jgi:ADP-heptose:LPS heptosyltransferase